MLERDEGVAVNAEREQHGPAGCQQANPQPVVVGRSAQLCNMMVASNFFNVLLLLPGSCVAQQVFASET